VCAFLCGVCSVCVWCDGSWSVYGVVCVGTCRCVRAWCVQVCAGVCVRGVRQSLRGG
jgi:hypothetical protein